MKTFLKLLLVFVVAIGGIKLVQTIKHEPAEGKVEMVVVKDDPMINDMGGVDGTTVMTEEEMMDSEMTEEVMEEEVMKEEVVEEVFMPLAFDGKLGKFIKKNKGVKVDLPGPWVKLYGAKKGARVGDDIYFKAKDGVLYVFHNGKLIKL